MIREIYSSLREGKKSVFFVSGRNRRKTVFLSASLIIRGHSATLYPKVINGPVP